MDSINYNQYQYNPREQAASRMDTAALICGILSLILVITGLLFPTMILSSIGIILALLSRGKNAHTTSKSKIAILLATLGLIFNLILCAFSIYLVMTSPALQNYVMEMYENIYGEPFPDGIFND